MSPLTRRGLLGAGAASALAGGLSGCSIFKRPEVRGAVSSANPFGVPPFSTIEALCSARFGAAPWKFAGNKVKANFADSTLAFAETAELEQAVAGRFAHGAPPDLLVNSGPGAMPMGSLLHKVSDLSAMLRVPNYDDVPMRDALVDGVIEAGTANGALLGLNYVQVVHGLWFSEALFGERGWRTPQTWAEFAALAKDAVAHDVAALGWTPQDASDVQTLVIDSAIKQGGDEVRLALDNLAPGGWQLPAVQQALTGLKALVDAQAVRRFETVAELRSAWLARQVALLPCGSWLEWQIASQLTPEFGLNAAPVPLSSEKSTLPYEAMHAAPEETVLIPRGAKDPYGGQELLRVMLSPEAARYVATQRFALPVVRGIVDTDGFGSRGLQAQVRLMTAAQGRTFGWRFSSWYGMAAKQLPLWHAFLSGGVSPQQLGSQLQAVSDAVRTDASVAKVAVR